MEDTPTHKYYHTRILEEILLESATISLAIPIKRFKSWKAAEILSSVARCFSLMPRSMPTIPARNRRSIWNSIFNLKK